jgi:methionyl-tRNA formyltransferase
MNNKIKIIFFGTPKFAEIILEKIIKSDNYEIIAVVTASDEPVGRKQILTASPVKIFAEKNVVKVLQPEKLDEEFYNRLKAVCHSEADLFITAAYGKIIPKNILDLPKFGCINIHPSLLPKYRGASPIQSALLNGDKETGITIMKMDEKMDNGPKISEIRYRISETDTTEILMEKMANIGAELLLKTIPDYLEGKIKPQEQNHNEATFCKIIKKIDGKIDWQKSAEQIYNQWRAFQPWPGVFFELRIKNKELGIKIIELSLTDLESQNKTGELFIGYNKLLVACGDRKLLEIRKIQPEGKKIMEAKEFINGYLR